MKKEPYFPSDFSKMEIGTTHSIKLYVDSAIEKGASRDEVITELKQLGWDSSDYRVHDNVSPRHGTWLFAAILRYVEDSVNARDTESAKFAQRFL